MGIVAHFRLSAAEGMVKCECFEEEDSDMVKGNYTVQRASSLGLYAM